MNAAGPSIAKQIAMKFLHPSYLVFRFFLRVRYFGQRIPRHQVASYLILRRYLLLCRVHNIDTWAFDGTLLGAVRNRKFTGRPGDLDFIVSEDDAERLHSLITDFLFAKTSFIRWFPLFKQTFAIEFHVSQSGMRIYRKIFVLGQMLQMLEISSAKLETRDDSKLLSFDSSLVCVDEHRFDASDFFECCHANIYGVQVRTPKNPERYLEILYGKDWMIPRVTKTEVLERKPHLWSLK